MTGVHAAMTQFPGQGSPGVPLAAPSSQVSPGSTVRFPHRPGRVVLVVVGGHAGAVVAVVLAVVVGVVRSGSARVVVEVVRVGSEEVVVVGVVVVVVELGASVAVKGSALSPFAFTLPTIVLQSPLIVAASLTRRSVPQLGHCAASFVPRRVARTVAARSAQWVPSAICLPCTSTSAGAGAMSATSASAPCVTR